MFRSFFKDRKWFSWAWGGGLFLLASLIVQVELTVKINEWYGRFYNMLQKATEHQLQEFWQELLIFGYIAFPYVLIATLTSYFTRLYAFRWREATYLRTGSRVNPAWSRGRRICSLKRGAGSLLFGALCEPTADF